MILSIQQMRLIKIRGCLSLGLFSLTALYGAHQVAVEPANLDVCNCVGSYCIVFGALYTLFGPCTHAERDVVRDFTVVFGTGLIVAAALRPSQEIAQLPVQQRMGDIEAPRVHAPRAAVGRNVSLRRRYAG